MRTICVAIVIGAGCGPKEPGSGTDAPPDLTIDTNQTDTSGAGDDVAGNSTADALPIDLYDLGAVYYGVPVVIAEETLNPAGDRDFYVLEGTIGQVWQFYTSSYYLNGYEVIADTVIRVYDQDGNLVVENDDMPYRFWETDSGVYINQTWDGPLYVEVLEFTDWMGMAPAGGEDYTYELIMVLPVNIETEPNDTIGDAIATYDAANADPDDDLFIPWWGSEYNGGYALEMWGQANADDVDYYALLAEEDGLYWQWSIWPGSTGDLEPELTLYDEGGNVLAQTAGESAEIGIDFPFLWDAGITYRVLAGHYYTVAVRNRNPGSASDWYTGINVGYLAFGELEFEPNDSSGLATALLMEESETTPGFFSGYMTGTLAVDDAADVVVVLNESVGDFDGNYLSAWLHATEAGSFLDPKLVITQKDTELANLTVSGEGNGGDVEIIDLELGDSNDIEFEITAESNTDFAPQNTWFLTVYVSSTPVGN